MSAYKNGNSSTDRVDPKMVTPSRHSVFIRGFPSNMSMESVRSFFKSETKENCKIDFFSYSEDRKKLFVALRFETHEKAVDVIENFDNKEVLGHVVEVSWFKDLRKARKQLIEEERATRNHESRSPVEWNVRNQSNYGRNGVYMWPGRYMRNRGIRAIGSFNRQRDMHRRMFNTRNTGCWRRARLSPAHQGRTRRDRTHSNSRSYSRSMSRSRSRSRSYSSKRRSYSSYSSRKSRDKSSSNKDIGHDSIHKYRMNKSKSLSSERHRLKRPYSSIAVQNDPNAAKMDTLIKCPEEPKVSPVVNLAESPNLVHAYSISPSESTASSNEMTNKLGKIINKRHRKKSKKRSKKRKMNKKSRDSDDNSTNERCVKLQEPEVEVSNVSLPKSIDDSKAPIILLTDIKDGEGICDKNCNVKGDLPNLTAEDHVKVLAKKDSLEKAFKKDCETVSAVSKLLISKKPAMEESILALLKSIFGDIGDKYVEELRSYVISLDNDKYKQAA